MIFRNLIKCVQFSNNGVKCIHNHRKNGIVRSHVFRQSQLLQNIDLLNYHIKNFHISYSLFNKEITGSDSSHGKNTTSNIIMTTDIEKLKESVKSNSNMKSSSDSSDKNIPPVTATQVDVPKSQEVVKKLPLWKRIINELVHYYHGFKLLFLEIKVTLGILNTLTKGQSLTRRERKQLVRTCADLARMVPFLVFIIVPFMEFLLPLYIKFFPFMMPSTFQVDTKENEKTRQILKGKLEIAKFLQDTLTENAKTKNVVLDGKINMATFGKFLKDVRESGLTANTEDILRYSQLFEDEVTLESLTQSQLQAICKMLDINAMGPPALLRFQLRMKVRHLKVDDQLIASEGLEKIPVWELQQLCKERGMRSIGVSEERLRYQLSQWLSLHLDKKVPITLLLLTRIIYLPDTFTDEEKLKQAILVLPKSVSNEAKLKAVDTDNRIDNKTKFEVIKEEQKVIKQERNEAKKAAKITASKVEGQPVVDVFEDKAPVIKTSADQPDLAAKIEIANAAVHVTPPSQEVKTEDIMKDVAPDVKPAISIEDLSKIGSAIVNIKDTKEIFSKKELEDLKESREVISKELPNVIPIKDTVAKRLGAKVDKMINEMDQIVNKLNEKKEVTEDGTKTFSTTKDEEKANSVKEKKMERFISIVDLKKTLCKMNLFPEDAKWQQILHILDEDGDGMIEMDHISEMIKLLGTEKVKISNNDVTKLLEMLDKEAIVSESNKSNIQEH